MTTASRFNLSLLEHAQISVDVDAINARTSHTVARFSIEESSRGRGGGGTIDSSLTYHSHTEVTLGRTAQRVVDWLKEHKD